MGRRDSTAGDATARIDPSDGSASDASKVLPLTTTDVGECLEQASAPIFVIDERGSATHANAAGRRELADARRSTERALAAAAASFEKGAAHATIICRIGGDTTARYLVVLAEGPSATERRVAEAARAWGLTGRQHEVLRQLALGEANKTIASKLGCAEATIEAHATAIFRKAKVEGRTELLSKLFRGR